MAVHDGIFHADDAVATAIIQAFACGVDGASKVKIVRSRKPEDIAAAYYVADVGGIYDPPTRRFDHHQWKPGSPGSARENGVPYASSGLVWLAYGTSIIHELMRQDFIKATLPPDDWATRMDDEAVARVAARVDKLLIEGIDAVDNGIVVENSNVMNIPQLVSQLNPPAMMTRLPATEFDFAFREAVEMAATVLATTILRAVEAERAVELVKAAVGKAIEAPQRYAVHPLLMELDPFVPFVDALWGIEGSEDARLSNAAASLQLVVFRSVNGNWLVQCVPPRGERNGKKLLTRAADGTASPGLPVEWAAKVEADLRAVTGVPDAVFCHANRFLAGAETREGALALAHLALRASGYVELEEVSAQ